MRKTNKTFSKTPKVRNFGEQNDDCVFVVITCYNDKLLNIYTFYNFKKVICSSISKLTIFSAHFCPPTFSTPKNFQQFFMQETSLLSRLLCSLFYSLMMVQ